MLTLQLEVIIVELAVIAGTLIGLVGIEFAKQSTKR